MPPPPPKKKCGGQRGGGGHKNVSEVVTECISCVTMCVYIPPGFGGGSCFVFPIHSLWQHSLLAANEANHCGTVDYHNLR